METDDTHSGLEKATVDTDTRKILHNGQLLILPGDKIYTIQGQAVKKF